MDTQKDHEQKVAGQLDLSASSAIEYLDRSLPILRGNLDLQRSSTPEQGMDILHQAVDGLQWLLEFMQIATEATSQTAPESSARFKSLGEQMFKAVQLLVEAMQNKDFPLLADVTEFELIDSMTLLREFLGQQFGGEV